MHRGHNFTSEERALEELGHDDHLEPELPRSIGRFRHQLFYFVGFTLTNGFVFLSSIPSAAAATPTVLITPSPTGLPGTATLESLLGGLQFDAMLAAIAGVIIGAAVWALGSHANNYQAAGRGKTALLASAVAALLIGFGPSLVQALFRTGANAS